MSDRPPFPYFDDDRFGGPADPDPTGQRLRRALAAEADRVEPGHDGLRQIKERIAAGDARGGGWGPGGRYLPLLAAAAAVLAAAGATFGILAVQRQPTAPAGQGTALPPSSPNPTATPDPTPTPISTPTGSQTPTSSPSRASTTTTGDRPQTAGPDAGRGPLPVYWVGQAADGSVHLYREFFPDPAGLANVGERVQAALDRMLAGEPLDPDYSSPWLPGGVSVGSSDTELIIEVPAKAIDPKLDGALAEAAIQQLVYTATAAAGTADPPRTVQLQVDGRATLWGIPLAETLSRRPEAVAPVWVTAPEEGSRQASGRVTVSGLGRGFEGVLGWQVTDAGGHTVAQGPAQGGSAGQLVPFSFEVELGPGRYTVGVWSPSAKDGADPMPFVDTKTFTVR